MTARRLPGPPGAAAPLLTFSFDGRTYEGIEGEPLAAALLAADRLILSRSFRFHRPRGLMCSTGGCGWCECEVDGVPSVRSCRVPVRQGLVARGEHALPSVERDVLSLVGLFSRWIPPTFYHHRFLRPRRLRKRYLDVLRWMGGRGRLRPGPRAALPGRPLRPVETDVLVVGAGRAGLVAAIGAAERGARVVVLEAERAPGGGWFAEDRASRAAAGQGADADPDQAPSADRTPSADLAHGPDPDGLAELVAAATVAGVEIMTGVTATGWYDGIVTAIGEAAHFEIRARAVVAAVGSYERVPLVRGADRPGVIAARTIAGLIRHGILPGERALLLGDGPELAEAAELLRGAGASLVAGPLPTSALVAVGGDRRVTGALIRDGAARRRVAVDVVIFADRSPNLDLVLAAGAAVARSGATLVPALDASGRTSVQSLFVAGSATGGPPEPRAEAGAARATGRAAADQALAAAPVAAQAVDVVKAAGAVEPIDVVAGIGRNAIVCFCEDVRAWEIRAEQAHGYDDAELIKRRTGTLTGPCQGKYCLQAFACLAGNASTDGRPSMPTARPPLRPLRLADLVAAPSEPEGDLA